MSKGPDDWLAGGLRILATDGAPAIRLDRLVTEVGLTKGSFYHHFGGMPQYRAALAAVVEERYTTRYVDAASQPGADARARLTTLRAMVASEPQEEQDLEVAFRAWAQQDPVVRAVQARIDDRRMRFLQGLLEELGLEPTAASDLGCSIYLTLVGGGHLVPPLDAARRDRIWQTLLDAVLGAPGRPSP